MIESYIDCEWKDVWKQNQSELMDVHKKSGDRAYGIYCFNLFKPLQERLEQAEILPKPMLPGSFSQSVEQWGSWENRERRFWSLLERKDGKRLGAIITRFYHDHTRLRLPKKT